MFALSIFLLFSVVEQAPDRELTGTWAAELVELNGADVTDAVFMTSIFPTKVRFGADSSIHLLWANGREAIGTYKLEPKSRVLTISFENKKNKMILNGIFLLDGDCFLFCCKELPSAATAPTRFSSQNNGIIYLLRRSK